MFAIGDREWPGLSKLVEETGEVAQVVGKLMGTRGDTQHYSGLDLRTALENELGDLLAAIKFVGSHCEALSANAIHSRAEEKYAQFVTWHLEESKETPHRTAHVWELKGESMVCQINGCGVEATLVTRQGDDGSRYGKAQYRRTGTTEWSDHDPGCHQDKTQ